MALLDVNELVQTIIDQAHTIRRMGAELERLQAIVAANQPEPTPRAEEPE